MKIGVLGGGQLGRMLALAGTPLGQEFVFLDAKPDACAAALGTHLIGEFTDESALRTLAEQVDVVTYESENMPLETIEMLEPHVKVYPPKEALRITQDRLEEKSLCTTRDIPTAPFIPIQDASDIPAAVEELGYPCLLKTRRLGYDGKGQVRLQSAEDLPVAQKLAQKQPCILEKMLTFEREVSIVACRSQQGETVFYSLAQNLHEGGILRTSRAPADVPATIEQQAKDIAASLLTYFDYIGIMAIEFFVMPDGRLLVNEMAPRVHNSGHWTIEGAHTSQFENHVRALCGLPLGSTKQRGHSVMLNILGEYPNLSDLLQYEGVHAHFYGKGERPGRKIGHVTVCRDAVEEVEEVVRAVEELGEIV